MFNLELKVTEDQSHTLFVKELNENYHSTKGAINEALHVYIQKGLFDYVNSYKSKQLNVLEIGFGTGLNTHLAHRFATQYAIEIDYHTIEVFPLPIQLVEQLNYPTLIDSDKNDFLKLHEVEWDKPMLIDKRFILTKINSRLEETKLKDNFFDVVFFDAFAPEKQPEMWTNTVFEQVIKSMKPNGFLVTYCAKGVIKRLLKSVEFKVETLDGPPGKREMIRAIKLI